MNPEYPITGQKFPYRAGKSPGNGPHKNESWQTNAHYIQPAGVNDWHRSLNNNQQGGSSKSRGGSRAGTAPTGSSSRTKALFNMREEMKMKNSGSRTKFTHQVPKKVVNDDSRLVMKQVYSWKS